MKSEYFLLLPNDICCSLQSFAAIALKTKKLWRKIFTVKCSSINYGATLKTSVFSTETTLDCVFHLLAYKNFHKLFYEWETNNFSRSGNWDKDS